jgi:hypothetical protein
MTAPALQTYRASIIYTGKHVDLDPSACLFITAATKEAAEKFTFDTMKKSGYKIDNFKVEVAASSKEEIEFYIANKFKSGYLGILN